MTHRDLPDRWRWPVHGRRTRIIVALLGLTLSLGVPAAVLGAPGLTVDGQPVSPPSDDPAGLGVTGALPDDPLPADPSAGVGSTGLADSADARPPGIATPPNLPDGPLGIPGAVLDAYQFAQRTLAATRAGCHLPWSVLAGIGRIESGHASGGRVDAFGNTLGPILGPQLDGSPGMAAIPDTDRGQLDTDLVWDRAVGPMQFIPSSWRSYGVDGNGDGVANPNNIYDATITTGLYLCAGGADLADPAQLQAAVFRYNHSATYVDIVLRWAHAYLTGAVPTPPAPGPVPPGTNGNGGLPVVVDAVPQAAAAAAPLAEPPSPVATSSPPVGPPPATTASSSPLPTATTAPSTATTPPSSTTTPPATTTSSAPPSLLPATTTVPAATTTSGAPPRLPPATTTTSAGSASPQAPPTTDPQLTTAPVPSLN
ncbi:MAG TPA: lytic murein transglycosylase [Mycobacterium sp.]|nr:lytic murein transglycosylase [Mycobacterium sp.]